MLSYFLTYIAKNEKEKEKHKTKLKSSNRAYSTYFSNAFYRVFHILHAAIFLFTVIYLVVNLSWILIYMNCPQNARDKRDNWVQTPTQICKPVVCLSLSGCVCVWECRTLYKACYWDSLRHARRGDSSTRSNHEMCQVQQTVTNLWQAAHATRNRNRTQAWVYSYYP